MDFGSPYDGNSGPNQRSFISNTKIDWEQLKRDVAKHASEGMSQYEFLEDLGVKLEGEARNVLDPSLDEWNGGQGIILNTNIEMAKQREVVRS